MRIMGVYLYKTLIVPNLNKKVLLRERKRYTARRVVSTPSVVLTGYPPHPDLARGEGGTLPWYSLAGYPPAGPGRVPPLLDLARYPPPAGPGRIPPPQLDLAGYPPYPQLDLVGYPPGCPMAFWEMLQSIMGYGYPPCGQTDGWKDRRMSKHYLPVVLRTRAVNIGN